MNILLYKSTLLFEKPLYLQKYKSTLIFVRTMETATAVKPDAELSSNSQSANIDVVPLSQLSNEQSNALNDFAFQSRFNVYHSDSENDDDDYEKRQDSLSAFRRFRDEVSLTPPVRHKVKISDELYGNNNSNIPRQSTSKLDEEITMDPLPKSNATLQDNLNYPEKDSIYVELFSKTKETYRQFKENISAQFSKFQNKTPIENEPLSKKDELERTDITESPKSSGINYEEYNKLNTSYSSNIPLEIKVNGKSLQEATDEIKDPFGRVFEEKIHMILCGGVLPTIEKVLTDLNIEIEKTQQMATKWDSILQKYRKLLETIESYKNIRNIIAYTGGTTAILYFCYQMALYRQMPAFLGNVASGIGSLFSNIPLSSMKPKTENIVEDTGVLRKVGSILDASHFSMTEIVISVGTISLGYGCLIMASKVLQLFKRFK